MTAGLQGIAHIHYTTAAMILFVAVFLGYNQHWPGGFMVLCFYVQEHRKAQPAVVLILKHLRRCGHGLKTHLTDYEKPGIEPATPCLQHIGLYPTPRRPRRQRYNIIILFDLLIIQYFKFVYGHAEAFINNLRIELTAVQFQYVSYVF